MGVGMTTNSTPLWCFKALETQEPTVFKDFLNKSFNVKARRPQESLPGGGGPGLTIVQLDPNGSQGTGTGDTCPKHSRNSDTKKALHSTIAYIGDGTTQISAAHAQFSKLGSLFTFSI